MIGLLPILARWRLGLSLAAALALLGLIAALSYYRNAYHAERVLRASDRAADRAAYVSAQAEAQAKAERDARTRLVALQAHTIKIEDERNELQTRFADLAARYRAANRLRGQTTQGAPGNVPSTVEDHGPGFHAPTTEAAELVAITGDDFDRCTVTAGDYVKLRDWALGLND